MTEEIVAPVKLDFKCERCGYEYVKEKDNPPYLCNRCVRFMGKQTWKTANQIQPPLSTPPTTKD